MPTINSFPVQTKTFVDLDVMPASALSNSDPLLIYDESVGIWKAITVAAIKGNNFTIDTVLDFPSTNTNIGDVYTTNGAVSVGDGGSGVFDIVDTPPFAADGYSVIQTATGWYAVIRPASGSLSLLCFGAERDSDCTVAITRAKLYSSLSGAKIIIPEGTFFYSGFVITQDNVVFEGAHRQLSVFKLLDSINTHGCEIAGCSNVTLRNFTIDQNRQGNLTGGHGIRFGGASQVTLENLRINNSRAYGIGMQAGTNTNINILNCRIATAGLDGIDIKDFNQLNDNIYIQNLAVVNHGQDEGEKPAIDWRGKLTVNGLFVSTNAAETIGIRARLQSTQGLAATGNISNVTCICNGVAANSNAIVLEGSAIATDIPRQVNINNFKVVGYQRIGLLGNRTIANLSNISGEAITGDCFLTFCAGVSVDGLKVTSCDRIFSAQPDTTGLKIRNAVVESIANASMFAISAGATNVDIDDCDFPAGKTFSDASGNETIKLSRIKNYPMKKKISSAALSVDSIGSKIFDIAHGFPFTPRIADVQLTINRDVGAVGDHRVQLLQVDAVNSTNVSGRMVVTTASATAGATVKVTASVETKYSI